VQAEKAAAKKTAQEEKAAAKAAAQDAKAAAKAAGQQAKLEEAPPPAKDNLEAGQADYKMTQSADGTPSVIDDAMGKIRAVDAFADDPGELKKVPSEHAKGPFKGFTRTPCCRTPHSLSFRATCHPPKPAPQLDFLG
jgi:hypothetical protein